MSIVVRTLAERVFSIIREQIVVGTLPTSAPIRQDALAEQLGVSKIPVREALARLEQEGLITSRANRGYFVRPMSLEQAEEIYALRLNIEPEATALGAMTADDDDRKAAQDAYDHLDNANDSNLGEVAARNREFHTALVRPGKRLLTTQLVERLSVLSERYVVAHLAPSGRGSRAHSEHRKLFDAWLERDGAVVERLLSEHIRGTLEDLKLQLDAKN